jgi:hypothetical protein
MPQKLNLPRVKEPCGKECYRDEKVARIVAATITDCEQRSGIKQPLCEVYYCTTCNAWHVGRAVQ